MVSSTLRMKAESSTMSTRVLLEGVDAMAGLCDRLSRLRSDELLDRFGELILLHRLGKEGDRTFLKGAVAMFCAGARSDHHNRNASRGRALAELSHEFVAGHARHFEVGDDQVAAVLRDKFGGFETVRSKHDPVAGFFEHAADELADADGIIGNDYDAFVLDAINGVGGDSALSHGSGARSEDSGGAVGCGDGLALAGFEGDHA